MTEQEFLHIQRIWKATEGKAWEPPNANSREESPFIAKMIDAGYIRRCDMRCGFEKLKDAGVTWTHAGKMAMAHSIGPMDDIPIVREDAG